MNEETEKIEPVEEVVVDDTDSGADGSLAEGADASLKRKKHIAIGVVAAVAVVALVGSGIAFAGNGSKPAEEPAQPAAIEQKEKSSLKQRRAC